MLLEFISADNARHVNFDRDDRSTLFGGDNGDIVYVDSQGVTSTPPASIGNGHRRDLRYMHTTWKLFAEFMKHFGMMQEEFNAVQERASVLSQSILSSWNTLRQAIAMHQVTLTERWLQMTEAQRTAILLHCWPGMQTRHRSDVQAAYDHIKISSPFRSTFINLEDLSNPMHLLLMVNSRTRHSPDQFAFQDLESSRIGLVRMHHMIEDEDASCFLPKTAMLMEDVGRLQNYGRLLPGAAQGRSWHPNSGFFVLKMQEVLFGFLLDVCQQVLDNEVFWEHIVDERFVDVHIPDLAAAIPQRPAKQLRLVTIAAEAHYKLQECPDYQDLFSLVDAQHEEAIDHVWLVREDPSYFSGIASDWLEHSVTLQIKYSNESDRLDAMYYDLLAAQLTSITLWASLKRLLGQLMKERTMVISPTQTSESKLSFDHAKTLQQLSLVLSLGRDIFTAVLKQAVINSPPLRPYLKLDREFIVQDGNAHKNISDTPRGTTLKKIVAERGTAPYRLIWLLAALSDRRQMWHVDLWTYLDELECLVQRSQEARELVSTTVARIISDLSVLAEIERQILLFHYDEWKDLELGQRGNEELASLKLAYQIISGIKKAGVKFATVGKLDGRFYHPSDQPQTKETVHQMRLAEHKLDKFWNKVDKAVLKQTGKAWFDIFQIEERSIERTAAWVEPAKENSAHKEHEQALIRGIEHQLILKNSDKVALARHTTKQKTHSMNTEVADSEVLPPPTAAETDSSAASSFQVDSDAIRVFDALFPTSKSLVQLKEVPWRDFLHAMTSIGCRAVKLYGSVWSFRTPADSTIQTVRKSINLHEPHPRAVLAPLQVKRIGRRLTRVFGWEHNSFIVE